MTDVLRRFLFLLVISLAIPDARPETKAYPYRWVFVMGGLRSDAEVNQIREIARTASQHGLNGMVLSAGLDKLELQPADYVERVRKVKAICDEYKLELIPQIFSAGYGGSVLGFDRNLAEGLSVINAPFAAHEGVARLQSDHTAGFVNGGLEEYAENRVRGFQAQEQPGTITFIDRAVFKEGKASLRFENFTANQSRQARLMQEIAVTPHRLYRVSCWVKTESLGQRDGLRIMVTGLNGRNVAPMYLRVVETGDWTRQATGFNSLDQDKVRISVGVSGARGGKLWLDDLRLEEIALVNVVRRPGTPVTVRSESGGAVYEEGRDFAPVKDPELNFRFDHEGPPIRLLPGSRIREGERLRVDYYHGLGIHSGQVSVCMSEPKLYEIWREQTRRLHELLAPQKYLLSMDEIRAGGSDLACRQRKMTMGEILGDCFHKQFRMLRALNPKGEIFTWSDMLDPNHNAHGNYYMVDGDYTGSWEHIPREMRIMCWYYERRDKSLKFFSGLGFQTIAGAYYDGDTLDNPKGWLASLDETPGARGIMYTTWQRKYALLPGFGDLVSGR
jgi:hypothetical protein